MGKCWGGRVLVLPAPELRGAIWRRNKNGRNGWLYLASDNMCHQRPNKLPILTRAHHTIDLRNRPELGMMCIAVEITGAGTGGAMAPEQKWTGGKNYRHGVDDAFDRLRGRCRR